ncbi:MAG TPA: response regulator [Deltaproteobacteria bacterium]|nr:response regulator [Deltaproteobacteria bacterium]HPJ94214.1 response regulator [Deltaproteobacteria bacterium]HPR51437.1 response regulator [Deltaproteobacteria bacterium]
MKRTFDLYTRLRNTKILLIDDDEWIRDSLSIFFAGEGCSLDAYETAEEGIKALRRNRYDIIITDYRLPGMDGLKFFGRIKKWCPHAIKILITAYPNREIYALAHEAGVHDYIEKPFTTKSIEEVLSRLLQLEDEKKAAIPFG